MSEHPDFGEVFDVVRAADEQKVAKELEQAYLVERLTAAGIPVIDSRLETEVLRLQAHAHLDDISQKDLSEDEVSMYIESNWLEFNGALDAVFDKSTPQYVCLELATQAKIKAEADLATANFINRRYVKRSVNADKLYTLGYISASGFKSWLPVLNEYLPGATPDEASLEEVTVRIGRIRTQEMGISVDRTHTLQTWLIDEFEINPLDNASTSGLSPEMLVNSFSRLFGVIDALPDGTTREQMLRDYQEKFRDYLIEKGVYNEKWARIFKMYFDEGFRPE